MHGFLRPGARAAGRWLVLVVLVLLAACSGSSRQAAAPGPPTAGTAGAVVAPAQTAPGEGATASPSVGPTVSASPPAAQPSTTPTAAATPTARPPLGATLTLLGHTDLGGSGFNGNVWEYGGFAYVGTWGFGAACPATGVRIIDLADPTQPRPIGAVAAIRGTSQEDVRVLHVSTAAFTGDLLATGIQRCDKSGQGGLDLVDVTDPRSPHDLGFFFTGPARGVHELDLLQQGDRVLALLAVPYSEADGGGGDFRIVDVSDPRHARQLSQWGAGSGLGVALDGGIGCHHAVFDHSARASADGRHVYLSYWDAGVIVLDIADPSMPTVAAWLQYPPDEEGETHSVAEADGGRYLVIADEDGIFGPPPGLRLRLDTPTGPLDVHACEALFSASLNRNGSTSGSIVDAGSGCPGDRLAANPAGAVAFVDAGGCTPAEAAARTAAAGAVAVVVAMPGDAVSPGGGQQLRIPVVAVGAAGAAALRQALAAGALPVTLPSERHSGGVRLWDISDLTAPRQVAVYQTADSVAFPAPTNGFYTAHNPEVSGDAAFISWYSDGLRVLDISDPANPREIAAFVPPAARNPLRASFPDQTLDWGVHLSGDLVLISDINGGLYVLRADVHR